MACVHTTLTKQPVPEIQENKYYSKPKRKHLAVLWTYKNTKKTKAYSMSLKDKI